MKKLLLMMCLLVSFLLLLPLIALAVDLKGVKEVLEATDIGLSLVLVLCGLIPGAGAVIPFLLFAKKTTSEIVEVVDKIPLQNQSVIAMARSAGKKKAEKQLLKLIPKPVFVPTRRNR